MSTRKKRKATPAQLRALAKGRKKRLLNLRKRKGKRRISRSKSVSSIKSPRKKRTRKRSNTLGSGIDSMQMLTGGTGDVNPQFMNIRIVQTATNSLATNNVVIPIARTKQFGAKTTVMEILKVFICFNEFPGMAGVNPAVQSHHTYGALLIGDQQALRSFEHWSIIACKYVRVVKMEIAGADSPWVIEQQMPWCWDLTDGQGHGILVATDSLTAQIHTTNYLPGGLNGVEIKILYRFKNVALTEYLGIVQGQQGI